MKQIKINYQPYDLIPVSVFRQTWHLPEDFGIRLFEPKPSAGLGSLDQSGNALTTIQENLMEVMPTTVSPDALMDYAEVLTNTFEYELVAVNEVINLKPVEVDFATAGFGDVMRAVVYKLVQLFHTYKQTPTKIEAEFNFTEVYWNWVDDSTRLGGNIYPYSTAEHEFEVRVIYNIYGRIGLEVLVNDEIYYVYDPILSCPASNYMLHLTEAVSQELCHALVQGLNQGSTSSPI
jgi:hypothetical protein